MELHENDTRKASKQSPIASKMETNGHTNGGSRHGRLEGKVALVTGGAMGIGEAICRRFAREGASILIADMNEKAAKDVAESLSSQGIKSDYVVANVTSRADWDNIATKIKTQFGRLDILVNNAGTAYPAQSSLTVSEANFDKVYSVNVKSIFHSVQAVFPLLIENKGGAVINISSIAAIRPRGRLTWYNSSKAAVSNASKALAHEFGAEGIRVNCVCPVLVPTQLANNFVPGFDGTPEQHAKAAQLLQIPLGRVTTTEDVANTALWLASDESCFITGVDHHVDGGRSI
jgi:NAD(P)-dependent dehydrogenase (short-subunit alcohol dehydrogenase family)